VDWYYASQTVDISMPYYVEKAIQRFDHVKPTIPQHSPQNCANPMYGTKFQLILALDPRFRYPCHVTFLYNARAVDSTLLILMGCLAAAQSKATTFNLHLLNWLLDYSSHYPAAKV
jgi:hypothetical protein